MNLVKIFWKETLASQQYQLFGTVEWRWKNLTLKHEPRNQRGVHMVEAAGIEPAS